MQESIGGPPLYSAIGFPSFEPVKKDELVPLLKQIAEENQIEILFVAEKRDPKGPRKVELTVKNGPISDDVRKKIESLGLLYQTSVKIIKKAS